MPGEKNGGNSAVQHKGLRSELCTHNTNVAVLSFTPIFLPAPLKVGGGGGGRQAATGVGGAAICTQLRPQRLAA